MYVMLAGYYPFQDPDQPSNNHATMWRVLDIKYEMPRDLSDGCKDLLRRIFVKDPRQRINMMGISQHAWFVQDLSPEVPLGPTQPGEADMQQGETVQSIEEIDAIVEAAKRGRSSTAVEEASTPPMTSAMMMMGAIDEFAEEDAIIASMASAGEF